MNPQRCLGVIRIGELAFAIPAEQLQEVVSEPLALSPLPDAAPCVLGQVILHEHTAAPVVDLLQLLRPAAPIPARAPLLVFLHCDAGRVAIPADEVVKVVRPRAQSFSQLSGGGPRPPALFRESFIDAAQVINILDVPALAEIPGVRFATAASVSGSERESAEIINFTLFQLDELRFAINIQSAARAMVVPELAGNNLPSPLLHGFFDFKGNQTALIDLRRLLGLPIAEVAPPDRMLVFEHAGRAFAVGIAQVLGIEKHSITQIEPVSDCGLPGAELYRGTIHSAAHGKILVLDPESLFAHAGVRNLVSIHDCVAVPVAAIATADRASYIVYRAGGSALATRMAQLEAVLSYPPDLVTLRQGQDSFLGFFTWQKKVLALIDLGALLGEPLLAPDHHQARVLIVRQGGEYRGYLVNQVESLQETAPKTLPRFAATGEVPKNPLGHVPAFTQMISVRTGQGYFNASVLELIDVRPTAGKHPQPHLGDDSSARAVVPDAALTPV